MLKQRNDASIDKIDRAELTSLIETKEFLAIIFCK